MFLCGRIVTRFRSIAHFPWEYSEISSSISKNYYGQCSISSCSNVESYSFSGNASLNQVDKGIGFRRKIDVDTVIGKVVASKSETEVFQSLVREFGVDSVQITDILVADLLHRFQDDWKSAMGVFRWAESCSGYKPSPELYDKLVDILGKMKQMERMQTLLEQMRENRIVSLNTIAKVMRRFAGARDWKDAVKTFDGLERFGLKKNTESMNLLLDTLCKELKVEQARSVFVELKSHISPNANTFNIFIHGWCKIRRFEEAQWTIQEMKGHGFQPCVISYSTIIQFYCFQGNFDRVHELLDEMEAQGCPPNVVTFTTIMHSLTKTDDFNEALQIAGRAKSAGCKLDTQFYNAVIHLLGRAGRVEEAVSVFTKEMPQKNINPNTSTYNTMIAMFCHRKQEERATQYLWKLEASQYCKPDVQSFYPLLKLYLGDGRIDTCLNSLLDDIVKKHRLCLNLATFTLLIHGLCKANKCEWAYQLFMEMVGQNIKPRYVTCSLLVEELKQKHKYDEAEAVEDLAKKLKSSRTMNASGNQSTTQVATHAPVPSMDQSIH